MERWYKADMTAKPFVELTITFQTYLRSTYHWMLADFDGVSVGHQITNLRPEAFRRWLISKDWEQAYWDSKHLSESTKQLLGKMAIDEVKKILSKPVR